VQIKKKKKQTHFNRAPRVKVNLHRTRHAQSAAIKRQKFHSTPKYRFGMLPTIYLFRHETRLKSWRNDSEEEKTVRETFFTVQDTRQGDRVVWESRGPGRNAGFFCNSVIFWIFGDCSIHNVFVENCWFFETAYHHEVKIFLFFKNFCFSKFEVINSVMSGALLSVLLVCNRRILRHQVRMSGTLVTEIKQCLQR
jgi:hypothetical protein